MMNVVELPGKIFIFRYINETRITLRNFLLALREMAVNEPRQDLIKLGEELWDDACKHN